MAQQSSDAPPNGKKAEQRRDAPPSTASITRSRKSNEQALGMALLRKPNRPKTLPIRHPWESRFKSAGNRFSHGDKNVGDPLLSLIFLRIISGQLQTPALNIAVVISISSSVSHRPVTLRIPSLDSWYVSG